MNWKKLLDQWRVQGLEALASPALVLDEQRVRANIRRMVEAVGGDSERLRPHMKTHKMSEVIRLQLALGIAKVKAATIAELELAGQCGVPDALLATQPVGPNQERLAQLREQYPRTQFSAICDDESVLRQLAGRFAGRPLRVWIDVDCGMGRSGAPGERVPELYRLARTLPGLEAAGLHAYDGHVTNPGLAERTKEFESAMDEVAALATSCGADAVIGGGSPTFLLHAARSAGMARWECSPGTTLLWDAGYAEKYPELPYEPAAFLISRVISRPGADRLCLDLGHKAVAAENPLGRRVRLLDLPEAEPVMQSEEHLVVTTSRASEFPVGSLIRALPVHICPTVALYAEACIVRDGRVTGEAWKVAARDRRITV